MTGGDSAISILPRRLTITEGSFDESQTENPG
jgi:hypothetical protein